MRRFSLRTLMREAGKAHLGWQRQWRSPEPRRRYDFIIVGGGNTGRNTTIIRSNYLYDESAAIYDHALALWRDLSQELNYNVMYSQRGVLMLAHNIHDVQSLKRHVYAKSRAFALAAREHGFAGCRDCTRVRLSEQHSPRARHPGSVRLYAAADAVPS